MWKFVASVHGTAAVWSDIDGGALLVYQKPGVYLRLHDLKLCEVPRGEEGVPRGEEGLPISSLFQDIFVESMLMQ